MESSARTRFSSSARAGLAALAVATHGACLLADVPPDIYKDASAYAPEEDASTTEDVSDGFDGAAANEDAALADAEAVEDAAQLPPNPDCDFSGRWLVTERLVATGIGIQQATFWWLYLDILQSGDELRLHKGLVCGSAAYRDGPLSVDVNMSKSWPAMQAKLALKKSGQVSLVQGRCEMEWGRDYRVIGATVPFYLDARRPLPSADQPATDGEAGWEDWDKDGKPGISIAISGALNGTRYSASRLWTSYAGRAAKRATNFRLAMDWKQEESVLGVTVDALKVQGAKDGDSTLHFAQFARLSDTQASGDDAAICAAVRALAPSLTAEAYE